MINPLYQEAMGRINFNDPAQMLASLRQNPVLFALKCNCNIPQNIPLNPTSITQYLLNSGQIPQSRYDMVMQMIRSYM